MKFDIIKNKIRTLKKSFIKKNSYFPFSLALSSVLYDLNGSSLKSKKLQTFFLNKKSEIIFKYLKTYEKDILDLIDENKTDKIVGKYHIWTFWYQGLEYAPNIVKQCCDRMIKNFDEENYVVHILDIKSIDQYIDIPNYIRDKVNDGRIGLALFSDFVRISLVEKYGGLWIDPTCYCMHPLQELRNYSFFSCKTNNMNPLLISKEQWANYCLGSSEKHSLLFQYLRLFLLDYWKNEETDIDYLLTDYLIRMAYNSIPSIKREIQSLEEINVKRGSLLCLLNEKYDNSKYNELGEQTWIFKLTYKQIFLENDGFGNPTFYKVLFGSNC